MADDPVGFRSDVHTELVDLAAIYKLPPLPEGTEPKIRAAVRVPERSDTQSFDDLRGKKVATGRGSIGHRLILAALKIEGMEGQ